MAKKYVCDRCGKIIDDTFGRCKMKQYFGSFVTDIDLCSDCEEEFNKWLNSKKDNKEEK